MKKKQGPHWIVVTGTSADETLTGTADADTLDGAGGNDVLMGLLGDDIMIGGLGDDVFHVEDMGDIVVEAAGEGNDRVVAYLSYVLPMGAEIERLEAVTPGATGAMDLTGNDLGQTIIGNDGVNFIRGEGGNDTLRGLAGNDVIDGGAGNDRMFGGPGDDTYYVDTASDIFMFEKVGEGIDRVVASATYVLYKGEELEILEAITPGATTAMDLQGNEIANRITGNEGVNVLRGQAGNDVLIALGGNDFLAGGENDDLMYGGLGDDTYYVDSAGDVVIEAVGDENDRVAALVSYTLDGEADIEVIDTANLTGTDAIDLTGNQFSQTIVGNAGANVLRGEGGGDVLIGGGSNDGLVGGIGDDQLVGGTGADMMDGGAGSDIFYVDDALDVVIDAVAPGDDRVATSVGYALGAEADIEVLEAVNMTDTAAMNLTGNQFSQAVTGNNGANTIDGKGGPDLLTGAGGADTFAFTTALHSANVDHIADFVSGTDRIALDDAVFTGLTVGALPAGAFVIGTQAGDADDRIIYNSATGALLFDADGNGAGAAVQFATLDGHPPIVAGDFTVI